MEEVLVIPKQCLSGRFQQSSVYPITEEEIQEIVKANGFFLKREVAEINYDCFQIIPYVLIKKGDAFFCTKRTKKQTEARLHDKISLGVGGHLNPEDGPLDEIIKMGMIRELEEELFFFHHEKKTFLGLLVDFSTDVSLVHLGLVYLIETKDEVAIKETDKMSGFWLHQEEIQLQENYENLESWSKIVFGVLK